MSSEIDHFLLSQIERHEGFRSKIYTCTAGKRSIGIGRNLDDVGITHKEAEFLLHNDLQEAVRMASTFSYYPKLSKKRKQALINLVFNMGLPKLKTFKKFHAAMDREDFETAKIELLDSKYAVQVGDRAIELAEQIKNG